MKPLKVVDAWKWFTDGIFYRRLPHTIIVFGVAFVGLGFVLFADAFALKVAGAVIITIPALLVTMYG